MPLVGNDGEGDDKDEYDDDYEDEEEEKEEEEQITIDNLTSNSSGHFSAQPSAWAACRQCNLKPPWLPLLFQAMDV